MKTKTNFYIFLLISLLVHSLLIVDLLTDENSGPQISYSIENIQDGVKKVSFIVKNRIREILNKPNLAKKQKTLDLEQNQVTDYVPKDILTEGGQSTELAKFLDVVRNEILKNKKYPTIARRLKHEGDVEIYFEISKFGKTINTKISKSSGSKLLDQESMDAVNAVEVSSHISSYKLNYPIVSLITINYKLAD